MGDRLLALINRILGIVSDYVPLFAWGVLIGAMICFRLENYQAATAAGVIAGALFLSRRKG